MTSGDWFIARAEHRSREWRDMHRWEDANLIDALLAEIKSLRGQK